MRLCADGTIIPRAAIIGEPIHRMDMRLQKRLPLVGRMTLFAIEIFAIET